MAPRRDSNSANSSTSILVQHQQTQYHQSQQQTFLYTPVALYNRSSLLETSNNNINNSANMPPMQTGNLSHSTLNDNTVGSGSSTTITQNGHHPQNQAVSNISNSNNINNNNQNGNMQEHFARCCYPNGDCLKLDAGLITLDDLSDVVRVLCNNENCNMGQYMHRECFDAWEQSVLATLKSMGRARSWSDRQRTQNLWTKKGYELVYKACVCKCGHGHIRKDIEWTPPAQTAGSKSCANLSGIQYGNVVGGQQRVLLVNNSIGIGNGISSSNTNTTNEDEDKKKKKKRNRNSNNATKSALPSINSSVLAAGGQQQQQQSQVQPPSLQQQQQSQVLQQPNQQQQQLLQQVAPQQNIVGNISNGINAICSPSNNKPPVGGNMIVSNNATNSTLLCSSNNNQLNGLNNSSVGVIGSGLHNNSGISNPTQLQQQQMQTTQQQQQQQAIASLNNILGLDLRARAGSLSSSGDGSGSTSPSASHSSGDISISPIHNQQQQQQQQQQHLQLQQYQQSLLQQNGLTKSILNGALTGCVDTIQRNAALLAVTQQPQPPPTGTPIVGGVGAVSGLNGLKQLTTYDQHLAQQQKNKEVELYSERVRLTSGCNGIFSRRLDFSSFNLLPKTRLNSYQVKIEDEGNHGNDETRLFILSSLAQSQMSRVACILCEEPMLVFDRYPLVDGSFFLSPKQHSAGCIEVKYEGRPLFLTCVCMACLDGTSTNRVINCRFCGEIWDGSNLVLGTMYSYDIFAAMPCCSERLKCNNCFKMLLHPQQRLNFYSDYSHCVTCPFCTTQDTHFVKPLSFCYTKSSVARHQSIA
ncbi:headcase protein [Eurosta solidaginis]|uniref:headcase protein n=1 Tax=Eurosta solidaginis TaxID=178769 RepID=UPI00353105A6